MSDYSTFAYGKVHYPLAASSSGSTLLLDADPALFYLLEFYSSVLNTHLGTRLLAEAASANAGRIQAAVAETIPLNPEAFLTSENFNFPLLCAYRLSSKYEYVGQSKLTVDKIEVSYVLPALTGGAAERLTPILYAVASVLDNRTERGFDPAYTPSGGDAGDPVWTAAGVARAEIKSVSYGGYALTEKLFFPSLTLSLELQQVSKQSLPEDMSSFTGADASVSLAATATEDELEDFVDFAADATP